MPTEAQTILTPEQLLERAETIRKLREMCSP